MKKPTFIDLFCGCGGFSLGLDRAGLSGLAAIDFNREAIEVFKANLPQIPHILEADVTKLTPRQLAAKIGADTIDVIVGGPRARDSVPFAKWMERTTVVVLLRTSGAIFTRSF